jgi:hypothetical protein
MENKEIQVQDAKSERLKKQLKLIEGKFTKREALDVINNVIDVKINFHKLQRLSIREGNEKSDCVYENSRIFDLLEDKERIKLFLLSLKDSGCNIKISSTINITVKD